MGVVGRRIEREDEAESLRAIRSRKLAMHAVQLA